MNCPECEASLPDDAVLCVSCGLNLKTGRRLKTTKKRKRLAEWDRDRGGRPVGVLWAAAGTAVILLCAACVVFTLVVDMAWKNALAGGVFLVNRRA